jgi:diadenosine tetraphosphate (Ap4A) HIT family hydrolase
MQVIKFGKFDIPKAHVIASTDQSFAFVNLKPLSPGVLPMHARGVLSIAALCPKFGKRTPPRTATVLSDKQGRHKLGEHRPAPATAPRHDLFLLCCWRNCITLGTSCSMLSSTGGSATINPELDGVVTGHTLVAPLRLVPRYKNMRADEVADIWQLAQAISGCLEHVHSADSMSLVIQVRMLCAEERYSAACKGSAHVSASLHS